MTTEKHDPWALLREARDQLVGAQGMGKATQTIARIDAALAEHADSATPVVESDESNAVWRAYANRELSEDEAKAKLAALEAKSAALAGRAECAVEWRPSDQRVFLDGVSLRIVLHTDGLWVWSVYWPLSHRTEQGRVATEGEAKSAALAAAKEKK
jgi:hypothetical protein